MKTHISVPSLSHREARSEPNGFVLSFVGPRGGYAGLVEISREEASALAERLREALDAANA